MTSSALHRLSLSAALCVAYAAAVVLGLNTATAPQIPGVATIWLANGFVAAGLLLLPRSWGVGLALACLALSFGYHLVLGHPALQSLVFPVIDMAEATGAAWLARQACGERAPLNDLRQLGRLVVLAIAPATACSALAAANASVIFGRSFDHTLMVWLPANAAGMALVLPAVLMLAQRWPRRSPAPEPATA